MQDSAQALMNSIHDGQTILIAGPTASGKSSLAMRIAQEQGGMIINADALQVYGCWRVLTARPCEKDEALVPHRLYGHVQWGQEWSAGHWLEAIKSLPRKPRWIIVGGTGLYFSALTQGLAELPDISPDIREQARQAVKDDGWKKLRCELDQLSLSHIDSQNPMRVVRAWEVLQQTGKSIVEWQNNMPPPFMPLESAHAILVNGPRDWLAKRAEARLLKMVQDGAIEEVRALQEIWDVNEPAAKAIGAPQLIDYISGKLSLDESLSNAIIQTRRYIKRQQAWFKARMSSWRYFDAQLLDD